MTFAFSPDGTAIATLQEGGRVALRSSAGGTSVPRVLGSGGIARGLAFSPDGQFLALGGPEPDVMLCGVRTLASGRPMKIPIQDTNSLAFSPNGRTLAATSFLAKEIILWDLVAGRERTRLRGHASKVDSIAFSPDGRTLAASGTATDIRLWNGTELVGSPVNDTAAP